MHALQEQANKLLADMRGLLAAADKESRGLTPEELVTYEAIEHDYDATRETLKRAATLAEEERALADFEAAIAGPGPKAGRRETDPVTPTTPTATPEYRQAFWQMVRGQQAELRALSVGTDTAGGYTVPDEFRRELVMALELANVMRPVSTVFPTSSGTLSVPVVSAHGSASWKTEAAAYAESDETFGQVQFTPWKATTLIKVSEELLNDSAFPLESYIASEFGRRLGALEETAFVVGTGSSQPTGVVGGSTLGKTATATNAITADELMDLQYALGRQYRRNARWLMHDSTVKAIRKLVTGVSGDKTYLWAPGLSANEPDRLLGHPIIVSNNMAEIATGAKVAVFGDFSYYYIADRQMISMQRLNELYAGNGQVGFRIFKRVDGKLVLATAAYHLIMA